MKTTVSTNEAEPLSAFARKHARLPLAIACAVFAASAAQAQAPGAGLEQIVVTAKKRSQDLRQVDISMSVISGETADALRLRTLPDAAALVEGVEVFEDFPGAGIPTWIIRGVGLQDFNSNNTPTAGVYLDDSYQVSTAMGGAGLFDVDQIEILKGPQGGLYGRNTSGGAVRLNTRRAELGNTEFWANAGYGSWQTTNAQAGFNVPLGESVALRVAGRSETANDGWQKSIAAGTTHGEKDRWDLRSWLTAELSDSVTVQWKVQGGKDASEIPLGRSIGLYERSGTPTICAAILAGRRDDANCINFGGVNRLYRARGEVPETIAIQSDDGRDVLSDPFNEQNTSYISSLVDVTVALRDMELHSISSFDNFGYGVALDLDGSFGEYGHRISTSDIRVYSQEFRLLSASASPLQWMAGISFSVEDFEENREFNLRENTLVPLFRGILHYDQNTRAAAAFTDVAYTLSSQWSINASLRYTDEDKEYRNGDLYVPITPPLYLARDLQRDYALDSNVSGSVSLNWTPDESLLAYGKLSRGFKSGGFYGGFPFSPIEVEPYLEETINAVELGIKKSFPQHALQVNGALFHYDYEDVQGYIQRINPLTNTGIDSLANQGDAKHDGAELQLEWQPLPRVSLVAGVAWLDARFVSTGKTTSNLLKQQVQITGRRPYAPEWSGNVMLTVRQDLSTGQYVDWSVGYDYRTDFAGHQSVPAEAAVNYLPGYGVMNASIGLGKNGSPWRARLWTHNMLGKTYRTRVKGDGLNSFIEMFGEPRSFGIDIEYRL
ncbi:MAG TPA: TonB-dependent receptor [Pseudomonadales bacterium]